MADLSRSVEKAADMQDHDNDGMSISFRLNGWKAVAVVAALIAGWFLFAIHSYRQSRTHIDEAKEHLRLWLVAEGARENLPEVQQIDWSKHSDEEIRSRLGRLSEATSVRIESLEMRGSWMGNPVFRVDYSVGGKVPSNGRGIRYFEMGYSSLLGWDVIPDESFEYVWRFAPFR
jgi:hypothetical protein